jgi:hypothetical protein
MEGLIAAQVLAKTRYKVECVGQDGKLKWTEEFDNLVVNVGLDKLLDATLKTGLASPAWYVGLKNTGSVVAGDTMGSHGGWTENETYSQGSRPACTFGTVSGQSVDNSASKAEFSINGSTTIYGAFLCDDNTKGGTTGILYGGGDFSSSRAVENNDTLYVTITCTTAAS